MGEVTRLLDLVTQPTADLGSVALVAVAAVAKQDCTVVLSMANHTSYCLVHRPRRLQIVPLASANEVGSLAAS